MYKTRKKRIPLNNVKGFSFDPVAHAYTLDGKALMGVTSILSVINKPMLIQWSANQACEAIEKCLETRPDSADGLLRNWAQALTNARTAHRKKKEDAGAKGTDVHADIETLIKKAINICGGYICPIADVASLKPQVKLFVDWANANKIKFLASELRMYSRKLWVAGTADFICEINGKLYVGDVKTSSGIYPEMFIQASAYAHMAREMGLYQDFHGVIIVNVPKTGGLNVKENYDLKGNFNAFKSALVLHKFLNK